MKYIYIRQHLAYEGYNAVKLGLTTSIANRDATYATGEIIRGEFYPVFKIIKSDLSLKDIESKLKLKYDYLNIKGFNGGTEFFNIQIINLIEEFFKEEHIGYKSLTKEEISKLLHVYNTQPTQPQQLEPTQPQQPEPQQPEPQQPEPQQPQQPEPQQPELQQPEPQQPEPQQPELQQPEPQQPEHKWIARDYQIKAIEYGFNQLMTNSKFYLELPTGGGKSYITYNIMAACIQDLDLIIIQSPRKIVNSQNISDKYIQLINIQKENVLNYSLDNNIDAFLKSNTELKIIIVCTQSIKLIYEHIKELKILIWFDEAHYGIENWVKEVGQISSDGGQQISSKDALQINDFYLTNTENIKYRIFSSASPDRSFIIKNSSIFGQLYAPTTVKQLIADKWLCPILPHIYKNNIENVNICTFTLNTFSSKGSKFGFSFHNLQEHAFELFYQHYIEYKENRTAIKPFLLIGDDFYSKLIKDLLTKEGKDKRSEQLHMIKSIEVDYDYLDIATFEGQFEEEYISFNFFSEEENKLKRAKKRNIRPIDECNRVGNHLAYVVAKFSIGYDFKLLDFSAFNDPKLSFKDIIQCIGRGIRPDCLGVYGSNLYKELILLIPIFYNKSPTEVTKSDYENIIEVIAYLLSDNVGLTPSEIRQIGGGMGGLKQIDTDATYTGEEDNESILLDIMQFMERSNKSMTYERAKSILADKHIESKEEYRNFYTSYNLQFFKSSELLPIEPNVTFPDFNWVDYLSIERGQYYTLADCQKQIKKIMKLRPELKQYRYNLDQLVKLLCIDSIHQNFPPYEFWEDCYKISLNIIISDNLFKSNKKIDI